MSVFFEATPSHEYSPEQMELLRTAGELASSNLVSCETFYGKRDVTRLEAVGYYAGRLLGGRNKADATEYPDAIVRSRGLKRVYLQTDYRHVPIGQSADGLSHALEVTQRTNFDTGRQLTLIEVVVADGDTTSTDTYAPREIDRKSLFDPLEPEQIQTLQTQLDACLSSIAPTNEQ